MQPNDRLGSFSLSSPANRAGLRNSFGGGGAFASFLLQSPQAAAAHRNSLFGGAGDMSGYPKSRLSSSSLLGGGVGGVAAAMSSAEEGLGGLRHHAAAADPLGLSWELLPMKPSTMADVEHLQPTTGGSSRASGGVAPAAASAGLLSASFDGAFFEGLEGASSLRNSLGPLGFQAGLSRLGSNSLMMADSEAEPDGLFLGARSSGGGGGGGAAGPPHSDFQPELVGLAPSMRTSSMRNGMHVAAAALSPTTARMLSTAGGARGSYRQPGGHTTGPTRGMSSYNLTSAASMHDMSFGAMPDLLEPPPFPEPSTAGGPKGKPSRGAAANLRPSPMASNSLLTAASASGSASGSVGAGAGASTAPRGAKAAKGKASGAPVLAAATTASSSAGSRAAAAAASGTTTAGGRNAQPNRTGMTTTSRRKPSKVSKDTADSEGLTDYSEAEAASAASLADEAEAAPAAHLPMRLPTRTAFSGLAEVQHTQLHAGHAALSLNLSSLADRTVVSPYTPLGKPLARADGLIIVSTEAQDYSAAQRPLPNELLLAHCHIGSRPTLTAIKTMPIPTLNSLRSARGWPPSLPCTYPEFVVDAEWLQPNEPQRSAAVLAMGQYLASVKLQTSSDGSTALHYSPVLLSDGGISTARIGGGAGGSRPSLFKQQLRCVGVNALRPGLVATGGHDMLLTVADITAATAVSCVPGGGVVADASWSPLDPNLLLWSCDQGSVHIADIRDLRQRVDIVTGLPAAFSLHAIDDRHVMVGYGSGQFQLLDVRRCGMGPQLAPIIDPVVPEIGDVCIEASTGRMVNFGADAWSLWQLSALRSGGGDGSNGSGSASAADSHTTTATLLAHDCIRKPATAPPFFSGLVGSMSVGPIPATEFGLRARTSGAFVPPATLAAHGGGGGGGGGGGTECAAAAPLMVVTDSYGTLSLYDISAGSLPPLHMDARRRFELPGPAAAAAAPAAADDPMTVLTAHLSSHAAALHSPTAAARLSPRAVAAAAARAISGPPPLPPSRGRGTGAAAVSALGR